MPIYCIRNTYDALDGREKNLDKYFFHSMKAYRKSWVIAPSILNIGYRLNCVSSFTPRSLYSREEDYWKLLNKKLGVPRSPSGRFGEEKRRRILLTVWSRTTDIYIYIYIYIYTHTQRQRERDVRNSSKWKRKEKSWDKYATVCKIDVVLTVLVQIKLLLTAKYFPTLWLNVVVSSSGSSSPRRSKHLLDCSVLKKEAAWSTKTYQFSSRRGLSTF